VKKKKQERRMNGKYVFRFEDWVGEGCGGGTYWSFGSHSDFLVDVFVSMSCTVSESVEQKSKKLREMATNEIMVFLIDMIWWEFEKVCEDFQQTWYKRIKKKGNQNLDIVYNEWINWNKRHGLSY